MYMNRLREALKLILHLHLKSPHTDYVFFRATDFDNDGFAMYKLLKKQKGVSVGVGKTIMVFFAPDDENAQELVQAWYNKTHFFLTHSRYVWYKKLSEKSLKYRDEWL